MTGRSATAGVAGGAGWGSSAGHSTTSGAGGTEPSDECGRMVLSCRRQPSMTTLASWSVEKTSPLSSSSRSSPRSRRSSGLLPRPTDPAPSAPPPAAASRRSPQPCAASFPSDPTPQAADQYRYPTSLDSFPTRSLTLQGSLLSISPPHYEAWFSPWRSAASAFQ